MRILNYIKKANFKEVKVILPLIVILFLILSTVALFFETSLSLDEVFTVNVASRSWSAMNRLLIYETNPPGFYYLTKIWLSLVGYNNDVLFRSLAIIFGALNILLFYVVGKKLFNQKTGLLASFLAALSAFFIHNHIEMRMYPIYLFLSLLLILIVYNLFFKGQKRWYLWLSFFVVSLLLVYLHLFAWFFLGLIFLFLIFFQKKLAVNKNDWLKLIGIFVLLISLFLIWFGPSFVYKFNSQTKEAWYFHLSHDPNLVMNIFSGQLIFFNQSEVIVFAVQLIIVVALLSCLVKTGVDKSQKKFFLTLDYSLKVLFLFFILLSAALFIILTNVRVLRYYIFALPSLYLLIAYGLVKLSKPWPKKIKIVLGLIIVLMLLVSYVSLRPIEKNYRYGRELAQYFAKQKINNQDMILTSHIMSKMYFNRYYHEPEVAIKNLIVDQYKDELAYIASHNWLDNLNSEDVKKLKQIIGDKNKVFFIYRGVSFNQVLLIGHWFLNNGWNLSDFSNFPNFLILEFKKGV